MRQAIVALMCVVLSGCGGNPVSPESEALEQVMSIANVNREPIVNAQGAIVGVTLAAEVVNTGPVPIISPFVMTWRLRTSNGEDIAQTTHRFSEFGAGTSRQVRFVLMFAARPNLSGVQDVVTFDFVARTLQSVSAPNLVGRRWGLQRSSLTSQRNSAAIDGADVCLSSFGGPWSMCAYKRHG